MIAAAVAAHPEGRPTYEDARRVYRRFCRLLGSWTEYTWMLADRPGELAEWLRSLAAEGHSIQLTAEGEVAP